MFVSQRKYDALARENERLRADLHVRREQLRDLRRAAHRARSDIGAAINEMVRESHKGLLQKAREIDAPIEDKDR